MGLYDREEVSTVLGERVGIEEADKNGDVYGITVETPVGLILG